jgi:peptidoglycan/LPS O-acetylase OafA/YrhL
MNPQHPVWPPAPKPPVPVPTPRPADVDTAFWLWLAAVPLLVIGQFADGYVVSRTMNTPSVLVTTALLAVIIGGVVVTFIVLMRSGYRWTRTLLTAGGIATILYTAASLLGTPRPPLPAVVYAVTGIIGAVLIGGGIFLLHRPDSNRFFEGT